MRERFMKQLFKSACTGARSETELPSSCRSSSELGDLRSYTSVECSIGRNVHDASSAIRNLPQKPAIGKLHRVRVPKRQGVGRRRQVGPRRRQVGPRRRQVGPRRRQVYPRRRQVGPRISRRRQASPRSPRRTQGQDLSNLGGPTSWFLWFYSY
jgi:hypothetical protein